MPEQSRLDRATTGEPDQGAIAARSPVRGTEFLDPTTRVSEESGDSTILREGWFVSLMTRLRGEHRHDQRQPEVMMRVRMVGIIVGAAVLWTVAPLSAFAVGCETNTDASIAVPGEKSASAEATCLGPVDVTVGLGASDGDGVTKAEAHGAVDIIGDDEDDAAASVPVFVSCSESEQQGPVMKTACSVREDAGM